MPGERFLFFLPACSNFVNLGLMKSVMKGTFLLVVALAVYLVTLSSCNTSVDGPSITAQQQFTNDTTALNTYLAAHSISYYRSATGIRFAIDSLGNGFPPRLDNEVKVDYTGKLLASGTVFDAGTADGTLSSYILGWQVGLSMLPRGTKGHLYIPSGLAYGTQSYGAIPPNANLIFDVNLKDVVTTAAETTQLSNDGKAVDTYLTNHSISATTDSTGARYVMNTVGTGPSPTWYSRVAITYSINELSTGNVYFSGTAAPSPSFDSRVVNYIRGMQVGLRKLQKGGTITLYLPSGLAYSSLGSSNGTTTIPPNTNVIVTITLTDFSNAN
jgi:FKBP-type peptidyl-prolyl cis-trans isomerase